MNIKMERKSLYDISWQVDEPTYRQGEGLSYSTLAKFERSGFNELEHLFDRIETPSLTFGSAVDSIITGGQEEFEDRFIVADYPDTPDSIIAIVKSLFTEFHETYSSLNDIPTEDIIGFASAHNYQNNWKPETRAKVVREKGADYYNLLYLAGDKTILNNQVYKEVMDAVDALKTSPATKFYFADNNPFENIERLYQLKFKAKLNGIEYKCMADLIIADYDKKTVQPIDLKTSSHTEWDFFRSFKDWRYDIQSRLYWKIIRDNMNRDPFFKDFKLLDYKFIVVNKKTLTPLVWDCDFTTAEGTLTFGKNGWISMRSPLEIGEELHSYLSSSPKVPKGIDEFGSNDLKTWLDTL